MQYSLEGLELRPCLSHKKRATNSPINIPTLSMHITISYFQQLLPKIQGILIQHYTNLMYMKAMLFNSPKQLVQLYRIYVGQYQS